MNRQRQDEAALRQLRERARIRGEDPDRVRLPDFRPVPTDRGGEREQPDLLDGPRQGADLPPPEPTAGGMTDDGVPIRSAAIPWAWRPGVSPSGVLVSASRVRIYFAIPEHRTLDGVVRDIVAPLVGASTVYPAAGLWAGEPECSAVLELRGSTLTAAEAQEIASALASQLKQGSVLLTVDPEAGYGAFVGPQSHHHQPGA